MPSLGHIRGLPPGWVILAYTRHLYQGHSALHMEYLCSAPFPSLPWNKAGGPPWGNIRPYGGGYLLVQINVHLHNNCTLVNFPAPVSVYTSHCSFYSGETRWALSTTTFPTFSTTLLPVAEWGPIVHLVHAHLTLDFLYLCIGWEGCFNWLQILICQWQSHVVLHQDDSLSAESSDPNVPTDPQRETKTPLTLGWFSGSLSL